MFRISQLKEYAQVLKDSVDELKSCHMAVTVEELSQILAKHKKDENLLLLALVPSHDMAGGQHDAQWINICGFFILEKTDYKHGRAEFLEIFERTQEAAYKVVEKMREDKDTGGGIYCNFLAGLDESSISIEPIKMQDDCNGHYLELNFKTRK